MHEQRDAGEVGQQPKHEIRQRHHQRRCDDRRDGVRGDAEKTERGALDHGERERSEEEHDVESGPGPLAVRVPGDEPEDRHEQDVVDGLDELQCRHSRGCYWPDFSVSMARMASRPSADFSGTGAWAGGTMSACSVGGSPDG